MIGRTYPVASGVSQSRRATGLRYAPNGENPKGFLGFLADAPMVRKAPNRERSAETVPFRGQIGTGNRHGLCRFVLAAGLALAFDPHVLLLAWPDARQETVAATSRATCAAAIGSIIAGRWLADDPPAVMRCEPGAAFAPGWDCIRGYNCGQRR